MGYIGEISIRDISNKYKLGLRYAENVISRLEEVGYIKKKNEYIYEIIRTEQEIDNYVKLHLEELRPQEYEEFGIKDNGEHTLKSKLEMNISYCKVVVPVFVRRILFSIPQMILLILWLPVLLFIDFDDSGMGIAEHIIFFIFLLVISYIFLAIPANVFIRIIQAKIYKMKFKDFMLLPKNWFFKRCKDTIDLCKLLYVNKVKFHIGSYENLLLQLEKILQQKKSLTEHYAYLANNAENENEFYQAINSCIVTLEWMSQFEKFGIFTDGQKPSDDILAINEGMPESIERFHKRMENIQPEENTDYDRMEGHQFEYFCADILRKNGFDNVDVTQGSGDHGIDILAEKDGITYAIQCKCYSSNIGNSAVQQAHTGKSIYNRDIAVVMTNRYFTSQAIEEAKTLRVKLWDRDKLNEMVGETSR